MTTTPFRAFRAAWIFPVAEPPVHDGIIEVGDDGAVLALRSGRDRDAIDLGNVALIPGLINAHAHLEFSDLQSPIAPATPFPTWVKNVVAHRRSRQQPIDTIIRQGLDEARRTGTIAIGEISTSDPKGCYSSDDIATTAFYEIIGPQPQHWVDLLARAQKHLENYRDKSQLLPGLSPHAPYTVPQELFDKTIDLAVRFSVPVAVHLAETSSELDLLSAGRGELVEMMDSLNLWSPELQPTGRKPLDWIQSLAHCRRGLVIHGNYLEDLELDLIAANLNLTLVYCPRTHAYFGHPPHPFRSLLDRGGRVAIGTDGRSSNPDLDLWAEGQFLRQRYPDLPCGTILSCLTQSGAESLGIEGNYGILAPGRQADFLAIQLHDCNQTAPPDLFDKRNSVRHVFRAGIATNYHDDGTPCHD